MNFKKLTYTYKSDRYKPAAFIKIYLILTNIKIKSYCQTLTSSDLSPLTALCPLEASRIS